MSLRKLISRWYSYRQNNQLQTPYNASKAAVKHLASSLAVEWAKDNVRVNSLRFAIHIYFNGSEDAINSQILNSPGYMMTKLTKTILDKDPELKVGEMFPWIFTAIN